MLFRSITVCISMAYALSRMVYSLARDGFLPQTFQKVSKINKVPHHATLLTGVLSAISAGIFSLANMASLVNIATLAYLVHMNAGVSGMFIIPMGVVATVASLSIAKIRI